MAGHANSAIALTPGFHGRPLVCPLPAGCRCAIPQWWSSCPGAAVTLAVVAGVAARPLRAIRGWAPPEARVICIGSLQLCATVKTIDFDRRRVRPLIPDVLSQACAGLRAGKTPQALKGTYSVGWSAKPGVLMLMARLVTTGHSEALGSAPTHKMDYAIDLRGSIVNSLHTPVDACADILNEIERPLCADPYRCLYGARNTTQEVFERMCTLCHVYIVRSVRTSNWVQATVVLVISTPRRFKTPKCIQY